MHQQRERERRDWSASTLFFILIMKRKKEKRKNLFLFFPVHSCTVAARYCWINNKKSSVGRSKGGTETGPSQAHSAGKKRGCFNHNVTLRRLPLPTTRLLLHCNGSLNNHTLSILFYLLLLVPLLLLLLLKEIIIIAVVVEFWWPLLMRSLPGGRPPASVR